MPTAICYVGIPQARDSKSQAIAGGLQSLCWGSAAVGGIVSAYFSGALLERMTTREVFSLTAYLPLLITLCALFVDETRKTDTLSRRDMLWLTLAHLGKKGFGLVLMHCFRPDCRGVNLEPMWTHCI